MKRKRKPVKAVRPRPPKDAIPFEFKGRKKTYLYRYINEEQE